MELSQLCGYIIQIKDIIHIILVLFKINLIWHQLYVGEHQSFFHLAMMIQETMHEWAYCVIQSETKVDAKLA